MEQLYSAVGEGEKVCCVRRGEWRVFTLKFGLNQRACFGKTVGYTEVREACDDFARGEGMHTCQGRAQDVEEFFGGGAFGKLVALVFCKSNIVGGNSARKSCVNERREGWKQGG